MFILVKLVDHSKHDAKNIKPDIIDQLTNEDLKKKSALVIHVCLNGHRIDWESSAFLAIESEYKKKKKNGF